MSYSYDRFLRPITSTDRNIQILDNTGIIKYTINPFSIVDSMVSNNLLKINLKGARIITINFSTSNEAKLALPRLQAQIDTLTLKVPLVIDKEIKNYISGGSYNLTLSNLIVTGTSSLTGHTILQYVSEVINPIGATNSTIVYDFTGGNIWYHGTASTDYTANFINLSTENNRSITTTIILSQGPTAYVPTIVQIDGVTQSVKWSGGVTASGSPDKVDIIGFKFIRTGSSWSQVLGNINPFG